MRIAFLNILIFMLFVNITNAQTLTVKISGIKNTKGKIKLAIFTSENEFKNETPRFEKIITKNNIVNGCISVSYNDIPKGKYGIAILDDENNNGIMDYSFFIPTEGFGFSDYFHSGLCKPKFEDFSFSLGNEDKTIKIVLKYM
ncbi:MAG TPA: DUF2141 domain-containing protein [Bacteroidales bacterium]|nr:DUF2141 domain-containing protein [Bacteroidales bacterium]